MRLCVCLGTQYVLVWKKVGLQRGKQRDYQTFNNVDTSYVITIAALLKPETVLWTIAKKY